MQKETIQKIFNTLETAYKKENFYTKQEEDMAIFSFDKLKATDDDIYEVFTNYLAEKQFIPSVSGMIVYYREYMHNKHNEQQEEKRKETEQQREIKNLFDSKHYVRPKDYMNKVYELAKKKKATQEQVYWIRDLLRKKNSMYFNWFDISLESSDKALKMFEDIDLKELPHEEVVFTKENAKYEEYNQVALVSDTDTNKVEYIGVMQGINDYGQVVSQRRLLDSERDFYELNKIDLYTYKSRREEEILKNNYYQKIK